MFILASNRLTQNTHETSLGELLDDRSYFRIPPFQRQYKWQKKQLTKLNDDISAMLDVNADGDEDGDSDVHFLGAVILDQVPQDPNQPKVYELIDGQQRITTFYLLMAAGVDVLCKNSHHEPAGEIALNYLFTRVGPTQLFPSIEPSIPDRDALKELLQKLWANGLAVALPTYNFNPLPTPGQHSSRILSNFTVLRRLLQDRYASQGLDNLLKYLSTAQSNLTVVQILVKDPTTGPSIFDSLNSSQEPMTTGELVRNEIFGKMARTSPKEAQELDSSLWQPFFSTFQRQGKSAFDDFFFPYGLIQDPSSKKRDVYRKLRQSWSDLTPEAVIANLKQYSSEYQDLQFGENKCDFSRPVSDAVLRLHRLRFPSVALPFLMQVLHHLRTGQISEEQGLSLLSATEAFLVRRALCGIEPTGLHAVFKRLWSQLENNFTAEQMRSVITAAATVQVPSDDDVVKSFEKPLYTKGIVRFFVFEFDLSRSGDPGAYSSSMWVEHILPQSYQPKLWPDFSQESHERLRHLAGNLIPLSAAMNDDVGVLPFEQKRTTYLEDSMFKSARELGSSYDSWTEREILDRTDELAHWAKVRWAF